MQFCEKCGSIMQPQKKGGKTVFACGGCKTTAEADVVPITETLEPKKEIEIVSEDDDSLPTTEEECSKCGNKEAYFWLQQTRAGDEPETKFLKCTACKHIWRDYS